MDTPFQFTMGLLGDFHFVDGLSAILKDLEKERTAYQQRLTGIVLLCSIFVPLPILTLVLSGRCSEIVYMFGMLSTIGLELTVLYMYAFFSEKLQMYLDRKYGERILILVCLTLMRYQMSAREQPQTHEAGDIFAAETSDPITGEDFRINEYVYILDDNRTTPIKASTLARLSSNDAARNVECRNPFTNMPLTRMTRVRIVGFLPPNVGR